MDAKKGLPAGGQQINPNKHVVRKRFRINGMGGCAICKGIENVATYTIYPKTLLSDTTDWNAGQRRAEWRRLPSISMKLCDDCIREHSRTLIGKALLQIVCCILLTAACVFLIDRIPVPFLQSCLRFVGVISAIGIFTGFIDILFTLSGTKKRKKPNMMDGQICVRDLIAFQFEQRKTKFDFK